MIQITEKAANAISSTIEDEGRDPQNSYLRVAVQGGGY